MVNYFFLVHRFLDLEEPYLDLIEDCALVTPKALHYCLSGRTDHVLPMGGRVKYIQAD